MILAIALTLLSMGATVAMGQPLMSATGAREQLCKPGDCFGLDYQSLALKYFKGIFLSKKQIEEKDQEWRARKAGMCNIKPHKPISGHPFLDLTRRERETQCGQDDHDQCCPTQLSHGCETNLNNTNGEPKTLLHFSFLEPKLYQWYPHAVCGQPGSCTGECRIEKITVYLLVYSLGSGWPFEFDSFEVNGYCSCKN